MRPQSLVNLLNSIREQSCTPREILIIDGSTNDETERVLNQPGSKLPIHYIKVEQPDRGLTRQRNIGIANINEHSEIVFFLDDDVILEPDFFQNMLHTFHDQTVIGCDGLITNECYWQPVQASNKLPRFCQQLDSYYLRLSSRDRARAALGLFPLNLQPGKIPAYGHGKSSLPPSGKLYEVDHIMGGITAYRTDIFRHIQFSTFFEGYGLYEDFDFSVRAGKFGKLITNTAARLSHHHDISGRPHFFKFGKMVVRNGWYVWRLKHPQPGIINILKWHAITLLLALFRLSNILSGSSIQRRDAWSDFAGRMTAWFRLLLQKPTHSA